MRRREPHASTTPPKSTHDLLHCQGEVVKTKLPEYATKVNRAYGTGEFTFENI